VSTRSRTPTLPELARRRRVYRALAFVVGLVLAVGVGLVIPI
jgi:hypothetical protein